jgi:hypothetical protein
MSLFEINCPMCKGTIWVDPSTGRVVDHQAADHQRASLDEFMKMQKNRGSALEEQFKKAKAEQEKRREQMDSQFRKAGQNDDGKPDTMRSPFDWD